MTPHRNIHVISEKTAKETAWKKRMDLSKLDVQTYFAYDIDVMNRKYGEGNWRFVYWKEDKKVELIRQSTYLT